MTRHPLSTLAALALCLLAPLTAYAALTWVQPTQLPGDDRVRLTRATAGHLRIDCYAYEPIEDVMFYDIFVPGIDAGTSAVLVRKAAGGTGWDAEPKCRKAAALAAQKLGSNIVAAIGTIK
jgi:hypothetical protein